MDEDVKLYIIELLTALGQMNHLRGKDAEPSLMTMRVEVRSELIAKGWWEILDKKHYIK